MARITFSILLVIISSCGFSKFNQKFDSKLSLRGYWSLTSINFKRGAAYPHIHFFEEGEGVLIQSLSRRYDFSYKIDSTYIQIKFEEDINYLNEENFEYNVLKKSKKLTTLILRTKNGKGHYVLVKDDSAQ